MLGVQALLCLALNTTACRGLLAASGVRVGAATSAYQVEGAAYAGCKGMSVWDAFTLNRTRIRDGSDGTVAADSYARYGEDVRLLDELSLHDYRFSFSWPRLLPTGKRFPVCQDGVHYYHALLDTLLARNITPHATLFHWDTPLALQESYGGWADPRIVDDFADYVEFVLDEFGSKVASWFTINEPFTVCAQGYAAGDHAPGVQEPYATPYLVGHHMLLAHGRAAEIIRAHYNGSRSAPIDIGLVLNGDYFIPEDGSPEAAAAAERAMDFTLHWFAQPVFGDGDYPQSMRERLGDRLPVLRPEDRALLRGSATVFALNHYSSKLVRAVTPVAAFGRDAGASAYPVPYAPPSDSSWLQMVPEGMSGMIRHIAQVYKPWWDNHPHASFMITECGVAAAARYADPRHDPFRLQFLLSYLAEALEAARDVGIRLSHFFVWSLLDNFEWAAGYTESFGIIQVNMSSPQRERTVRDSARFLQSILAPAGS